MREQCVQEKWEAENLVKTRIWQLEHAAPELLAALAAIVDFCDDPHGSEQPESLAMGLSRLLPTARAAIAKAEGAVPELPLERQNHIPPER